MINISMRLVGTYKEAVLNVDRLTWTSPLMDEAESEDAAKNLLRAAIELTTHLEDGALEDCIYRAITILEQDYG